MKEGSVHVVKAYFHWGLPGRAGFLSIIRFSESVGVDSSLPVYFDSSIQPLTVDSSIQSRFSVDSLIQSRFTGDDDKSRLTVDSSIQSRFTVDSSIYSWFTVS
ncbi:hypothetical protein CEXT_804271 [Caerostris extrusa]|uniref:Uncharacterized protein n=1 Tax=Caerostris extrusa TaxID=172846 RepID=A0AAV4X950_CAEEX|nr:hypothetical protein CEXT_804271 [Caerostris extrusa]